MTTISVRTRSIGWVVAGLFAGVMAPAASGSRGEIEQLLREMQIAVLSGNPGMYVRLVDPSEPVFLQEQVAWAEDLKSHKPVVFEILIKGTEEKAAEGEGKADGAPEGEKTSEGAGSEGDGSAEPVVKIGDGFAEAPIEITWSLAGWEKPRTVSWTARFRQGESGWMYSGEKWNRLESDGVLVLYADGLDEAAKAVVETLPEVRRHAHPGFGFDEESDLAKRTQQVKMYGSMRHLQHSIYLSYTDGLAGWNEPGEAVKLLVGRRTTPQSLKPLLAHEYGHVATFAMGNTARMPWWVLEGVAELAAEEYSKNGDRNDRQVRRWKANNELPAFEEMAAFDARAKKWYGQVYGQGHHMMGYMSDRFGREKRIEWLQAQANGLTMEEATVKVLGLSFVELEREWRDSILPWEEEKKEEKKEGEKVEAGKE
ncbi:MAG: hypothetical protein IT435_03385 [Phycisphaerales bacterium]|nr:hypothetical protein [Phycisphaerales bacterium]